MREDTSFNKVIWYEEPLALGGRDCGRQITPLLPSISKHQEVTGMSLLQLRLGVATSLGQFAPPERRPMDRAGRDRQLRRTALDRPGRVRPIRIHVGWIA